MIRLAAPTDAPGLLALGEETGMFVGDELESLAHMLDAYFQDAPQQTRQEGGAEVLDGQEVWLVDEDAGLRGAAYLAREMMAQGVWNLLFLGVQKSARRGGRAAALVARAEALARAAGARILIVETSSDPAFGPARQLYLDAGYDQEARIRAFYTAAEDKIVFRKALT